METDRQEEPRGLRPGVIAAGGIMIAVGALMWVNSSGWLDVPIGRLVGPFVLITLGALIVVEKGGFVYGYRGRGEDGRPRMRARKRGGAMSGLWLIGIGAWMMLVQTHAFGLNYHNAWPILIIMSGIGMLVRGVR